MMIGVMLKSKIFVIENDIKIVVCWMEMLFVLDIKKVIEIVLFVLKCEFFIYFEVLSGVYVVKLFVLLY